MGHDMVMIGVDGGGTATRAVLTTRDGRCLGYGVAGRGNPISAGVEQAAGAVLDAVSAAVAMSGRAMGDVSMIAAALAGQAVNGAGAALLRARLEEAGFDGALRFESDLLATYFSGTAADSGYAIVSGTGACAIRVEDGRIVATADGLGWLLGDRGSGYWIGQRVAKAVIRDLDDAGPATALTPRLLERWGIQSHVTRSAGAEGRPLALEQLVTTLYALVPIELAALAPLAFDHPDDPVAAGILRRAGAHLADSLVAVLAAPGPLVIGGSILSRPGAVRDAFHRRLGDGAVVEVSPVADGAVGAAVLALRADGCSVTQDRLDCLVETVERMR
ncbi:N-acetylglucosamine kinase [Microbacterium sp. GXF0217]